ncbi:MAG: hypothetical protein DHS20C05_25390 [Hyphococcus sp.]|nr:MAG: hypothetical protein DHS20C05_25390 [Marinicaulis sp.]
MLNFKIKSVFKTFSRLVHSTIAATALFGCGLNNEEKGPDAPSQPQPAITLQLEPRSHPEFHARMSWSADETEFRNYARPQYAGIFWRGDFERLEIIAEVYRQGGADARTGSGLFKQLFFYQTFRGHEFINANDIKPEAQELLARWAEAYPSSPAPHIAKAKMLYSIVEANNFGLDAPNQRANYLKHVETAQKQLSKIWPLIAEESEAHNHRLLLTLKSPEIRNNWRPIYEEAREKAPGYYQLYFNILWFAPRKPGTKSALTLLDEISDDLVEDTPNENMAGYARAYWAASQLNSNMFALMRKRLVKSELFRAGFYDVLESYPDIWNANAFAFYSCALGDHETFKNVMSAIDGNLIDDIWDARTQQGCIEWANNSPPA